MRMQSGIKRATTRLVGQRAREVFVQSLLLLRLQPQRCQKSGRWRTTERLRWRTMRVGDSVDCAVSDGGVLKQQVSA